MSILFHNQAVTIILYICFHIAITRGMMKMTITTIVTRTMTMTTTIVTGTKKIIVTKTMNMNTSMTRTAVPKLR